MFESRAFELKFREAFAADAAFSNVLRRLYGPRAGDARYNPRLNRVTPELAAAADRKTRADTALHAVFEASRRGAS